MNQIAIYDEYRAQLAELKEDTKKLVFDYEDSAGNKEARSHVYKLRQTKAAVDKARKKEKAASLEYGREVDSQAKEITLELEQMIDVHQKPLEEIETREKERVAKHESNISEMREGGEHTSNNWMELSVEAMADRLAEIENEGIDSYEEFAPVAAGTKDRAITQIKEAIAKREAYDKEQAELEKLRAEAVEREKKEAEEKLRIEGEERAKREAEAKAEEEKQRVKLEAERIEKEKNEALQAKVFAEKRALEAEENAKIEAEKAAQAERDRIESERLAEEIAAKKREANKAHKTKINNAVLDALVLTGMNKTQAKKAVTAIAKGEVPYTTISY